MKEQALFIMKIRRNLHANTRTVQETQINEPGRT